MEGKTAPEMYDQGCMTLLSLCSPQTFHLPGVRGFLLLGSILLVFLPEAPLWDTLGAKNGGCLSSLHVFPSPLHPSPEQSAANHRPSKDIP